MVTAYVMVKALTGEADEIKQAILALDGVVDVYIVAGDVDLIVKLEVPSPGDVKDVAPNQIHAVEGVDSTQTYIAME